MRSPPDGHRELLGGQDVVRRVEAVRVGRQALVAGADAELVGGQHVVRLLDACGSRSPGIWLFIVPIVTTPMDEGTQVELEAAAFRRLVEHLRERADVQNIDLMELAGLLPQLPLALVPGGGRGARRGADRPTGAGDRLRDALRGVEVAPPNMTLRGLRPWPPAGLLTSPRFASRRWPAAAAARWSRTERAAGRRPAEVVLNAAGGRRGQGGRRRARGQARAAPSARAVELEGAGAAPDAPAGGDAPSPGAPSDARCAPSCARPAPRWPRFRAYLDTTAFLPTGPRARVLPDGTAVAPEDAPDVVKRVILAGNAIAKFPYKWGGGHGAWRDNGYDCSGSVSFALAAAGLLDRPLTSGLFMRYGGGRARASGSRSTPTAATCSWSWRACASTPAAKAAPARAGRRGAAGRRLRGASHPRALERSIFVTFS